MSEETEQPKPARVAAPASPAPSSSVFVDSLEPAAIAFGLPDGSSIAFGSGLNSISARVWASATSHPLIAERIKAKSLVEVRLEELGPEQMMDVVARTTNRDVLETLLVIEAAKPVTAGPTKRRNPAVVEMLRRKVAKLPVKKAS